MYVTKHNFGTYFEKHVRLASSCYRFKAKTRFGWPSYNMINYLETEGSYHLGFIHKYKR